MNDDHLCNKLKILFEHLFPTLTIIGGVDEPYYEAPRADTNAKIFFKENYPRSLLHEIAHYCLAGQKRRKLDDYGYWYTECGRTSEEEPCRIGYHVLSDSDKIKYYGNNI